MKPSSLRRAALAASLSLIATSCANLDKQLHDASVDQGKVAAGVQLPPLPPDCRAHEPHAPDDIGAEAIVLWKAERKVTNRANARTDRCATNYDNVAAALAGTTP